MDTCRFDPCPTHHFLDRSKQQPSPTIGGNLEPVTSAAV